MKMDITGQFASVLLQAPSSSACLAFAETLTFIVTPVITGEVGSFSASTVTLTLFSSMLLFLQTLANIVTPQSAKAINANSKAVGPLSFPS